MKRALGRILLVALGLLGGFAITEWTVFTFLDAYQCDEQLGWVFAPGSHTTKLSRAREYPPIPVSINSHGFRDPERQLAKPAGTFRIAILGDSIPAALQVLEDEDFARQLERELASDLPAGQTVEVLNTAVDGYGTAQALRLYQERVARFEPDVVILSMYLGNDLTDNSTHANRSSHYLERRCGRPYFAVRGDELVRLGTPESWRPSSPSLLDRMLRVSRLYANFVTLPPPEGPTLRNVDRFQVETNPLLEEAWELTERIVLELRNEVAKRGAQFVVMSVPSKYEVRQAPHPDFSPEIHDLDVPLRRLGRFLAEAGISHLELAPEIAARVAAGEALYFDIDSHFTPAGHDVVSAVMHSWLLEHCATLGLQADGCGT